MRSLNETTQLIRDEHKKLRGLFIQIRATRARESQLFRAVVNETCDELQIYLEREQKLLFPKVHRAIQAKGGNETRETEFIHQSLRDHHEIVDAIREVKFLKTATDSFDWDDKVGDLTSLTLAYLVGEEKQLLPFVEKHLPITDASLSEKWFDLGDEIRTRIHATTPSDPKHAQNLGGGEQRRKAS